MFVTWFPKYIFVPTSVLQLEQFSSHEGETKLCSVSTNDLLTGLLGPYQEIRSPIFLVRPELARAVRKSEGFVFPVRTE